MSSADLLERISSITLPNGLKLICLKKDGAPVVSVQIWYRTGSVNERSGIRGISHFFEHMMFRGSANYGSEEHARRINECGGHCNAFTAEDITAYVNSVPVEHLDMVLAMEADRMQSLAITPEVLETERKVIVEEYHTYMNNPVAKAFLEFRHAFYGEHPYAISALGEIEDIGRITVDECREYYHRWYAPSNAILVVVGAFESTEVLQGAVERHFGSVPGGATVAAPVPAETGFERCGPVPWLKRRVDFDVPLMLTGYPAPSSSHDNALALEMLQQIVSHGETGRIHKELVRKSGVAVMAGGMNHLLKHSGMSLFFAAFTPDIAPRRVADALAREVETVATTGIGIRELEKVRSNTLAGRLFELYSGEHICQRIGYCEAIDGDYRIWVERMNALEKISGEELIDVARTYWTESRRWTLYLKPRKVKPLLFAVGLARRLAPRWLLNRKGGA